jgi:hypothetical protein
MTPALQYRKPNFAAISSLKTNKIEFQVTFKHAAEYKH